MIKKNENYVINIFHNMYQIVVQDSAILVSNRKLSF